MEKNPKVTQILSKALSVCARILLGMLLLFVLMAGLLQIPQIQTRATKILTNYLSDQTGFKTDIQKVNIRWWDALSLGGVR